MDLIAILLGVLLVVLVLWDLFETIVVPRPTPGWFRIARYVVRGFWRLFRAAGTRGGGPRRDTLLGLYAPFATLALLISWLTSLIVGYGLILYAIRGQLSPSPTNLAETTYFAASSVLTLGSADVVASGEGARLIVVVAAATGLGVVALVVTFLFSLYGSYQRREMRVVTLQAAAGAPPSAIMLLETYARLDLAAGLPALFADWKVWAAEVLDTHVAYPLLGFFRSSHDNLSWVSSLGTVLDAASLVLTTIERVPRGEAELFRRVGAHLVEDIANLGFRSGVARPQSSELHSGLDRAAFAEACHRLAVAGYVLAPIDEAWPQFEAARSAYVTGLEGMAAYWATPANSWLDSGAVLRSPAHTPED
ncbi:MAG TPA: ion channel [Candidatus Limnocylindrales bacterium]